MFGLVVAGRPLQLNPQQVAANKFIFTITEASTVNHLVVFLTGSINFPDGFGASVFVAWPPALVPQFLGFLSSSKQSAIFKISSDDKKPPVFPGIPDIAQLGLSVEPLSDIEASIAAAQQRTGVSLSTEKLAYTDKSDLPKKVVENFYQYCSSFGTTDLQAAMRSSSEVIPSNVLTKWYNNVSSKLKADPTYFK